MEAREATWSWLWSKVQAACDDVWLDVKVSRRRFNPKTLPKAGKVGR